MMKERIIYKYSLERSTGVQLVPVGRNVKPLSFRVQGGEELIVWWEQDNDGKSSDRVIHVVLAFTGIPFNTMDGDEFLGTAEDDAGLVWHCYIRA